MIQWLVQSGSDLPEPAAGEIPSSVLSAAEETHYRGLHSAKRRRDWLLGRWTAKRLLQAVLTGQDGKTAPALAEIQIANDPRGVPISLRPRPLTGGQLSISHGHGRAFCAVSLESFPIGADLESVEPRSERFVTDYFTRGERQLVEVVTATRRSLLTTAIWSGKEAALKALQLGLSVTCLFDPAGGAPRWTPFEIVVDRRRLPEAAVSLRGWWRFAGDFVYTLALPAGSAAPADRPVLEQA